MSDNPKHCENYLRLIRLIVEVGTQVVRDLFYKYKPKEKVAGFFDSETIRNELFDLKRKLIITSEQYYKLIDNPDPDKFDLSLLITIIVNLFKWTVEKPENGWNKPIGSNDNTLGASLLRLKKLRNNLVAHSSDAKLTTECFDMYWEEAENCLMRIAKYTGNNAIEDLPLLQWYKTSSLDGATNEEKCEYLVLMRKWYEENISVLTNLQKEVESLCKLTNEFVLFFKSDIPERYKRYVLLLNEGGMLVLADVLRREMKKSTTDLLEPNICPSKLGLKEMADMILGRFQNLSETERKAISCLGNAYAEYARIAMVSLDGDKFRPYWTDVVQQITILSVGLEETTQKECHNLIKKHDTEPFSEDVVNNYLFRMQKNCFPNKSLAEQYIEAKDKLKLAVEQMEREGACFKNDHVFELKMVAHGKTKNKRQLAENILFTVWEKAVSLSDNPESFEEIEESVNNILEGIRGLPNVKVKSVEKHCIILSIECSSFNGILSILDFVESSLWMEFILSIRHFLSRMFEETILVTTFISVESIFKSMQNLLTDVPVIDVKRGIAIEVSCSSINEVKAIRDFIRSSKTTNDVNLIAQNLSNTVEEKIMVETSLDMAELEDIDSYKTFDIFKDSKWTPFMLPPQRIENDESMPDSNVSLLSKIFEDITHIAECGKTECNQTHQDKSCQCPIMEEMIEYQNKQHGKLYSAEDLEVQGYFINATNGPHSNWRDKNILKCKSPMNRLRSSSLPNLKLLNQSFIEYDGVRHVLLRPRSQDIVSRTNRYSSHMFHIDPRPLNFVWQCPSDDNSDENNFDSSNELGNCFHRRSAFRSKYNSSENMAKSFADSLKSETDDKDEQDLSGYGSANSFASAASNASRLSTLSMY